MLNVVELVNYLRLHPENRQYVIDQLWLDFYNRISYNDNNVIIGRPYLFVDAVNITLKNMDLVYNSVKNVDCSYIWAVLFYRIRNIALNYYVFIVNPSFLNLEFRYSHKKIEIAESRDEARKFMGLSTNFTKEELVRCYRKLALKYHPDKGGSAEDFRKLQVYKEQLERSFC